VCGLFACNNVRFTELPAEVRDTLVVPPTPTPVDPPVPVDPLPVDPPVAKQTAGDCAADSSTQLLSCLSCEIPMNPPTPPQLSYKGSALLEGMTMACQIPNGSDPSGYVPPTREQLLARLNRASPTLYPDTSMTSQQVSVITGLINTTDSSMRNRLFGGLWYRPPYSDAFETYFGISTQEARYQFCYGSSNTFTMTNSIPLQSKAFMDCQFSDNAFSCRETPAYVAANGYRNQLRNAMRESINNPYVPPAPTPSKTCRWEKYEGEYDVIAQAKVAEWLGKGFKVAMTVNNLGGRCEAVSGIDSTLRGAVTMAAYVCK